MVPSGSQSGRVLTKSLTKSNNFYEKCSGALTNWDYRRRAQKLFHLWQAECNGVRKPSSSKCLNEPVHLILWLDIFLHNFYALLLRSGRHSPFHRPRLPTKHIITSQFCIPKCFLLSWNYVSCFLGVRKWNTKDPCQCKSESNHENVFALVMKHPDF